MAAPRRSRQRRDFRSRAEAVALSLAECLQERIHATRRIAALCKGSVERAPLRISQKGCAPKFPVRKNAKRRLPVCLRNFCKILCCFQALQKLRALLIRHSETIWYCLLTAVCHQKQLTGEFISHFQVARVHRESYPVSDAAETVCQHPNANIIRVRKSLQLYPIVAVRMKLCAEHLPAPHRET